MWPPRSGATWSLEQLQQSNLVEAGLRNESQKLSGPYGINSAWRDAFARGSMVFCNNCGKDNPAESEFCIHCGTRLVQPVSVVGSVPSTDPGILMKLSIV